jgi:hypothetical protein
MLLGLWVIINSLNLNVAKPEEAADPRRQGKSSTEIMRVLDNTGGNLINLKRFKIKKEYAQ